MDTLFSIIIVIASILLVGVVFIQNPKGGGLSSDFGAAQQIGGVQKTNDFIDKTTWGLAGLVAVLSIVLTIRFSSDDIIPQADEPAPTEQGGAPAANAPATPKTGG
ncbi:MAG: preprotein translocase subunit SecG [Fluviicola sp.]|nr:MAG: preprotein translocase subunit SecG [Fluviicola sp.]